MINLEYKKNKKIGILGLARTGEATYLALKPYAEILCYDDMEKNRTSFAEKYGLNELLPISNPLWQKLDEIILSPGIPITQPKAHAIIEFAKKYNIKISSDIDLLYGAKPQAYYIAITGTNGKSTTTSLIHHIVSRNPNISYDIGGNIGNAVMNMNNNADGYVLELSSFQIELLKDFKPNIAIILNITPDHLDRHGSMEHYIKVKKSLVQNIAKNGVNILSLDNEITAKIYEEVKSLTTTIPISTKKIVKGGICVMNGMIYDAMGDEVQEYKLPENKSLQGEHNRENVAAAFAAVIVSKNSKDSSTESTQKSPADAVTTASESGPRNYKDWIPDIFYETSGMTTTNSPAVVEQEKEKLANAEGFIGDTERRTAAYFRVREDSSTESTQKSPADAVTPASESGPRNDKDWIPDIFYENSGMTTTNSPAVVEFVIKGISSFKALPHRMQYLGTKYGIEFYNDSKATNAEAAEKSIASLDNIYLLAGGVPKEGGIEKLLHLHKNITKAYLFGEAKDLFGQQIKGYVEFEICDSMKEAFDKALRDARMKNSKANILLAPACASYDQFKDFEERGYNFIKLYDSI